jgi:PBP1b-binding outer membrane lipoprotein LpoB
MFPAFHFWFTGTALFLAGSFIFTVIVALIGIREMVTHKQFAALILAALLLSGLAWRTAAKQEADSAAQDTTAQQLQAQITGLKGQLTKSGTSTDSRLTGLETKADQEAVLIKKIAAAANINTDQSTDALTNQIISRLADVDGRLAVVQQQNTTLMSQNGQLIGKNTDMDADLKRIAEAANLKPTSQSPEGISNQIIQYLASLDSRLHSVEYPPRDPNSLYDGPRVVAQVAIAGQPVNGAFTLAGMTSSAPFNFSKTYFLQTAVIKCDATPATGTVSFGAESHYEYHNVSCKIVGRAPQ